MPETRTPPPGTNSWTHGFVVGMAIGVALMITIMCCGSILT